MLRELSYVNEVYIDSFSTGLESILILKPEIFAWGYDQNTLWEEKLQKYFAARGIAPEYVRIETQTKIHTSDFLKE